ncbi:DNA replication and repair protein RecF [Candidatus Saccharibacteria bacterium]|nr:DNA replication and repair protein RecF [Candidatus Saccharibacteria bacterium]
MIIQNIKLTNFRNHSKYHLDFKPDTTLILGANGCGKTSVLEAIYILTRGKSFRATDPEIIKKGTPFYHIELQYNNGQKSTATYDGTTKTFLIADKKAHRLPSKHKHPIVLFEPQDLNLITGSPTRHRDYFDNIFSQLNEDYASLINKYKKAKEQRNKLLKSDVCTPVNLFSWNLLLAKYGTKIFKYRNFFTNQINQSLNQVYHSIAENSDQIQINYLSKAKNLTESEFLKKLEESKEKDLILGYTTFGISSDDYNFIFNNKNASTTASRGESRSIVLALKFIESHLLEQKLHARPIVLLDDVFSELDNSRRKCLVKNFKNHQVIITSVEDIK